MSTTTKTATNDSIQTYLKWFFIVLAGIIVAAVHYILFRVNRNVFTVLLCFYIVFYAVMTIVITQVNKNCLSHWSYVLSMNMSLYTIILALFLISLTFMNVYNTPPY
jgi:hypothetical protein